ncbi:unnamed protein product, partial [Brassica oleracea]
LQTQKFDLFFFKFIPSVFTGNNQPDHRLPPRLFATDRFPSGRHNIYSKPELLAFIHHVLRDTEEFKYIRSSCFGKLFDLPARQCLSSGKLIHAMLTRQLVCGDKHTLWSVFGSDPIKFGLQEFGTITGLPCGAFPVGYTLDKEDQSTANKDPDWIKLIGKKRFTTIADLRHKLETDRHMPGRKKLQLALIIIVDGVFIAHQQTPRPTLKYVRMVQDVDAFCSHPWGRESFIKTIDCMKPLKFVPLKCEDPIRAMVQLLKQESLRLRGFPLALQLLAYQAVPKLQSTIPIPYDSRTIMDLDGPNLPFYPAPSAIDIIRVEADPDAQPTDDSDIVSLSDGSPVPETPKHIPSMGEDHLAKQLLGCKTVPAPDLLSPLPQIEWDLFKKIIPKFSAAFHITPSKLDFSNNFLLQLARPMNWTTTYVQFHHISFHIYEMQLTFTVVT